MKNVYSRIGIVYLVVKNEPATPLNSCVAISIPEFKGVDGWHQSSPS